MAWGGMAWGGQGLGGEVRGHGGAQMRVVTALVHTLKTQGAAYK